MSNITGFVSSSIRIPSIFEVKLSVDLPSSHVLTQEVPDREVTLSGLSDFLHAVKSIVIKKAKTRLFPKYL
ncbi:MAG: hypothetical protein ACRC0A_06065 [Chitinophagaceae bacterium]